MCSTDHNKILHMSQQYYCHDMCKISLWLAKYVMNKSISKFHWILNSIEILLVGQAPGIIDIFLSSTLYLRIQLMLSQHKVLLVSNFIHVYWHYMLYDFLLIPSTVSKQLASYLVATRRLSWCSLWTTQTQPTATSVSLLVPKITTSRWASINSLAPGRCGNDF